MHVDSQGETYMRAIEDGTFEKTKAMESKRNPNGYFDHYQYLHTMGSPQMLKMGMYINQLKTILNPEKIDQYIKESNALMEQKLKPYYKK